MTAPGTETAAPAGTQALRTTLEAEVSRRAASFDPLALTDLLHHMGYRPEEIFFESQPGASSAGSLVQSIQFKDEPMRHVVVSIQVGLLGAQGPLPSYFAQLLSGGDVDEGAFLQFLHFFDHRVIEGFLKGAGVERDANVFHDFDATKRSYLGLLGLRSTATLHWLFALVFPELDVKVDRATLRRSISLGETRLNFSKLGSGSVLGGQTKVPVPGFSVTLYCDEEQTDFGFPWVEEVRRRLDAHVFPLASAVSLDLRVSVVIRSEKVWAQLSTTSYLGFDRMKGGKRRNREVLVWNGEVTRASRCLRGDRVKTQVGVTDP